MTFRAIEILKSVDLILAEDTRTSGKLLKHFNISTPARPYHQFNEHKVVQNLVAELKNGKDFALITDAGTPGISDPGFLIARECLRSGVEIQCLPGATAFVPALINSGLPAVRFCFEGFIPPKKGRKTYLESLREERRTMIFYESPYRLLRTLKDFGQIFGEERQCGISRELSKLHEENFRGTIREAIAHFSTGDIKGEIVITVAGIDI